MNDLNILGTQSTPTITSNWSQGLLVLQGDSYPENSYELFTAVIAWVESYLAEGELPLLVELRLVYMNTSSVKAMMDIFDLLEDAHSSGRKVEVRWYYDPRNERVLDLADEFKEDCSFPFLIAPDER